MTDEFAINILEQYREKPTLINEIETVEEAVWLDEALNMAINALEREQQFLDAGYKNGRVEFMIGGRKFMVKEMAQ